MYEEMFSTERRERYLLYESTQRKGEAPHPLPTNQLDSEDHACVCKSKNERISVVLCLHWKD